MADLSPDQWLRWLTERMDARRTRLLELRARLDGCGPLPEVSESVKDAYRDFQRKARTTWEQLIVESVAERMAMSGVRVGDDPKDDDRARGILARNRMTILEPDVYRDMLGMSVGYLSVTGVGPRGGQRAVITYERPEQVITEDDPLDPWTQRAGLKIWRDLVAGRDYAVLSIPGAMYRWWRPCVAAAWASNKPPVLASGGWQPLDFITGLVPWVSMVPFVNAGGVAEFEPHRDLLDRIDYGVLQRLVIAAMQAYRQRAIETADGKPLPETDEAGNVIDYGALFKPGAGALWELPAGVKLWESQTTDATWLLNASKDDIRTLAAVTRTPMSTLIPDGANMAAEGAAFAREGLVFKTENRIERAKASMNLVIARSLAIEAGTTQLPQVSVDYKPAAQRSLSERADAATKAANDLPWRTRITDIWGYDADAADRMETQRAQDALILGMTQPTPALPAPAPTQVPGPAQIEA